MSTARDTPVVRPATDDDAPGIVALIRACFAEYDHCVLDLERESRHLLAPATFYAGLGGAAWVAVRDGVVTGTVAWHPVERNRAELHMLYVAAAERRRGVATALVALVEDTARATGAREVELWSDTRFVDAHRLYGNLGYEQLPETRELHDLSDTVEFHFTKRVDAPGSGDDED